MPCDAILDLLDHALLDSGGSLAWPRSCHTRVARCNEIVRVSCLVTWHGSLPGARGIHDHSLIFLCEVRRPRFSLRVTPSEP